jgi:hypothetical protein
MVINIVNDADSHTTNSIIVIENENFSEVNWNNVWIALIVVLLFVAGIFGCVWLVAYYFSPESINTSSKNGSGAVASFKADNKNTFQLFNPTVYITTATSFKDI